MYALASLALSPADSGDQARVRRLNEFHGHQICRTLPVRQKERSMVPLVCASASASTRDPSHIKEHWAAVSVSVAEPDTGRSFCSGFLCLASCFLLLASHFLFAAILAISAAVLCVRVI